MAEHSYIKGDDGNNEVFQKHPVFGIGTIGHVTNYFYQANLHLIDSQWGLSNE